MSDIVERLKLSACGNCQIALDEIERLRAHNEHLRTYAVWEENEQLRAAGKETLEALETLGEDGWSDAPHLMRLWRLALERRKG